MHVKNIMILFTRRPAYERCNKNHQMCENYTANNKIFQEHQLKSQEISRSSRLPSKDRGRAVADQVFPEFSVLRMAYSDTSHIIYFPEGVLLFDVWK